MMTKHSPGRGKYSEERKKEKDMKMESDGEKGRYMPLKGQRIFYVSVCVLVCL